ncbi:MAG: methyltransferase [Caldilineaceae bacterium]
MADDSSVPSGAVPPGAVLWQMMTGYWVSQAIYVAAKLGVADLLVDGPRPVEELAAATQADPAALRRVLRALASSGVFTETSPGAFALTPMAALLRSGVPDSMRSLAIMYAEEQYRAWGDMLHSVQTGKTAFERQFGTSYFAYLAQHPAANHVFNEAMSGYTMQLVGAVVDAYDFSPFQTIVDVGGSYGTLLEGTLLSNPTARGILFDQPHVANAAGEVLAATPVADRCTTVGGDFFVEVPAGGDAYLLAQILHDWDDERSVAILQQCRRAISQQGRLLVIELVLPEGEEPFPGKWLDLHMLAMLGGRERTAAEYAVLFNAAGFELTRVVPTTAGPSVVEAVPV